MGLYLQEFRQAVTLTCLWDELAEEIDLLDTMLSSPIELLEEKGILTQKEWEDRIKGKTTIE